MTDTIYDIAIIGAGIVGTSIARRLSRYRLSIAILEKEPDVAMGATKANSAIVHGGYAESSDTQRGRLCYQGRKQFARLDSELHFGFKQTGSLVFTTRQEDRAELEELLENGKRNGLNDLYLIDGKKALQIEPNLNPDVRWALYCRGAGICSPYEMAIAMAENAVQNGAKLYLNEPVNDIQKQEDIFRLTTPRQTLHARYVINCAGINAAAISAMTAPIRYEITPRTGEYILMVRGSGKALNTVVFQMPTPMGKGVLVTPTIHGNLLLGPDAIDEAGTFSRSTHADRLAEVYFHARHTTGKVNIKQFLRSFAGVRAVATGDDFIIGPSGAEGCIQAAGIQSPGLTSSPAIADMVTEILQDEGLVLSERDTYDPNRKPIIEIGREMLSIRERDKRVALPQGDTRLVCRCEQVAQGIILDALYRGIPVTTVDGVKRRTRAMAGYCQGDFCRPRVAKLMEREYGKPVSPKTDAEMRGDRRVTKTELVKYIAGVKGID